MYDPKTAEEVVDQQSAENATNESTENQSGGDGNGTLKD